MIDLILCQKCHCVDRSPGVSLECHVCGELIQLRTYVEVKTVERGGLLGWAGGLCDRVSDLPFFAIPRQGWRAWAWNKLDDAAIWLKFRRVV